MGEDRDIPVFVADFLCGPWAQAVAESQLTYTDSMGADLAELVDELLWSVQPRVARLNRIRLVELIPNLLARLRVGLQLISYPPEMTVRFFDNLIGLHEAILEGGRARGEVLASASELSLSLQAWVEVTEAPWIVGQEAIESGFLEENSVMPLDLSNDDQASDPSAQASVAGAEMTTTTWVELMFEGQWVRAQLTWVSPHRTLFMFNSAGRKAHSMSRRTLNRLRTQGLMRVVSDGNLVDNALDAMTQVALRNSLDQPAR